MGLLFLQLGVEEGVRLKAKNSSFHFHLHCRLIDQRTTKLLLFMLVSYLLNHNMKDLLVVLQKVSSFQKSVWF